MATRCYYVISVLGLGLILDVFGSAAGAQGTWRVSVDSAGSQANGDNGVASISANGRFVAFESEATNLVPGDTNDREDIFVHDRQSGTTTRVSVHSLGGQGYRDSSDPSISGSGRFVAFESEACNLVPGDTNDTGDIFVHDRDTGITTRVSVDSAGRQGDGNSVDPSISADGRFVAFSSISTNLVPLDTGRTSDVFVHDRQTKTTTRVSVSSSGEEGNGGSVNPSISGDGHCVAFRSIATNLVTRDINREWDIFVHTRLTGETTLVSVSSSGDQAHNSSFDPSISEDGRYVAFDNRADNLVAGDTNDEYDVFVHDRQTGTTTRVSVDSSGNQGSDHSHVGLISGNGQLVLFTSRADNLVPGDTNVDADAFLHDRQSGATRRVSVDSTGNQANDGSAGASLSTNGRFVAFISSASNLVPGDTNRLRDTFVHGPYLTLEAIPDTVATGDSITLTTWEGSPSALALLFLVDINGTPTMDRVALGMFDGRGHFTLSAIVPPGCTRTVNPCISSVQAD